MKTCLLIAALMLAGCYQVSTESEGKWSETSQETGIRVRWHPASARSLVLQDLDRLYRQTEQCTKLSALGPDIIEAVESIEVGGNVYYGYTWFDDGLILSMMYEDVLKHEFVHYLLAENGEDPDRNREHESFLFVLCGWIAGGER